MSIVACRHVWKQSKQSGGALLVLLALADMANPSGECWPSVAYLAKMCRMSVRNVQKHLQKLSTAGEIIIEAQAGKPTGHGSTNRYRIVMAKVNTATPQKAVTGETEFTARGEPSDTARGELGDTQNPPVEPSFEPYVVGENLESSTPPPDDDDLAYFQAFNKRWSTPNPDMGARLSIQRQRLGAKQTHKVVERCIGKAARSWEYVAVALEGEPLPPSSVPPPSPLAGADYISPYCVNHPDYVPFDETDETVEAAPTAAA